nr:uncharacterized protein LOC111513720 [Leptinotarsa decemlineata]
MGLLLSLSPLPHPLFQRSETLVQALKTDVMISRPSRHQSIMSDDSEDIGKKINNLNLTDKKDINILLLGETGVGKSTFINSVANYLTYNDLKTAKKENLIVLIPTEFSMKDKNGEFHIISIGDKDNNEYLDTGVSATQDVKTYVFPIWNGRAKVRLIDTPGMGDTRGITQDNINSENILSYIGQLHELHAICFLFKPNQSRNTVFFRYCMSQILSRLDKSASKNIIFGFTNTRGSDYGPGETINLLKREVESIREKQDQAEIPINRNVFCFDNEAFRYLAAMKQNVEFDESIKQRNKESWKNSSEQCWKLINYIVGDPKNPPLKPHHVKSTSAINEARRMIQQLAQPLAEISQLINSNVQALERHKANMQLDNQSLEELRSKLYMPVISLEVIKLTQPVTVCTARKCADIYKVGSENKWHYKQRCHDPCFLSNVPKEIIGTPELIHCAAMDGTSNCIKCGCDFKIHMHVYYMTKTIEVREVDPNVEKNINSKEAIMNNMRKVMGSIIDRKEELDNEHHTIVKICARFAHFLQNNAITPFSDSYKEYIEYLINREKSLGKLCDAQTVEHLQKLLREYEETKASFEEALKMNKKIGRTDQIVSAKDISDSIQELYKLKHNGKKIKELYECQKKARNKEHENTEYLHNISFKAEEKKSKKPDDKTGKDKQSTENRNKRISDTDNRNRQQNSQPNRGNASSRRNDFQRYPSRDAPPAYHEVNQRQHHYSPPQAAGPHPNGYYPPYQMGYSYGPPPNAYGPPPNAYGPPPAGNAYGPPPITGPYGAHQGHFPGADPYKYGHDYQYPSDRRDDRLAYDINITVKKPGDDSRGRPTLDHFSYPPQDPYYRPYDPAVSGHYATPPTGTYQSPPGRNPAGSSGYDHHHGVLNHSYERSRVNNSRTGYDQGRGGNRGRGGINKRAKKRNNNKTNADRNTSDDSDS